MIHNHEVEGSSPSLATKSPVESKILLHIRALYAKSGVIEPLIPERCAQLDPEKVVSSVRNLHET